MSTQTDTAKAVPDADPQPAAAPTPNPDVPDDSLLTTDLLDAIRPIAGRDGWSGGWCNELEQYLRQKLNIHLSARSNDRDRLTLDDYGSAPRLIRRRTLAALLKEIMGSHPEHARQLKPVLVDRFRLAEFMPFNDTYQVTFTLSLTRDQLTLLGVSDTYLDTERGIRETVWRLADRSRAMERGQVSITPDPRREEMGTPLPALRQ